MGDFLNKAGRLARYAADKTGDAVEIGKYKASIASQKSKISDLEKNIGRGCYNLYTQGQEFPEEIIQLCKDIDEANKQIKDLEENIKKVKDDEDIESL